MSKEEDEKAEIKKAPPTPPIRNKGEKGEEERPSPAASARAREVAMVAVLDVHTPPTLELALAFAHVRVKCDDDDYVRAWYQEMSEVYMWVNPKTGLPLRHWPAYLRASINNHCKTSQPSKHKRRNHFGKRPVNWLAPTEGEDYANSPF